MSGAFTEDMNQTTATWARQVPFHAHDVFDGGDRSKWELEQEVSLADFNSMQYFGNYGSQRPPMGGPMGPYDSPAPDHSVVPAVDSAPDHPAPGSVSTDDFATQYYEVEWPQDQEHPNAAHQNDVASSTHPSHPSHPSLHHGHSHGHSHQPQPDMFQPDEQPVAYTDAGNDFDHTPLARSLSHNHDQSGLDQGLDQSLDNDYLHAENPQPDAPAAFDNPSFYLQNSIELRDVPAPKPEQIEPATTYNYDPRGSGLPIEYAGAYMNDVTMDFAFSPAEYQDQQYQADQNKEWIESQLRSFQDSINDKQQLPPHPIPGAASINSANTPTPPSSVDSTTEKARPKFHNYFPQIGPQPHWLQPVYGRRNAPETKAPRQGRTARTSSSSSNGSRPVVTNTRSNGSRSQAITKPRKTATKSNKLSANKLSSAASSMTGMRLPRTKNDSNSHKMTKDDNSQRFTTTYFPADPDPRRVHRRSASTTRFLATFEESTSPDSLALSQQGVKLEDTHGRQDLTGESSNERAVSEEDLASPKNGAPMSGLYKVESWPTNPRNPSFGFDEVLYGQESDDGLDSPTLNIPEVLSGYSNDNTSINEESDEESDSDESEETSPRESRSSSAKKSKRGKPLVCPVCGKIFKRDLTRHIRTHEEVARFICPFPRDQCSHKRGQFNRPYDFKKHLLHYHFTFDKAKVVLKFRDLQSKLDFSGHCRCGKYFVAKDWLENHILGGDLCPLLATSKDPRCQ